jgi:hypothetical protein
MIAVLESVRATLKAVDAAPQAVRSLLDGGEVKSL